MSEEYTLSVYHDSFSWRKHKDILDIKISEKTKISVVGVTTRDNIFYVGHVCYNGSLLDYEMPFGVFHYPSKNVFSVWRTRYYAEVYADTVSHGRDWSGKKLVFENLLDARMFQATPTIISQALNAGGKPIDPSYNLMKATVN